MQNKLKKLKDTLESKPSHLVEQKVIFPIFSFDLSGEVDADSIVQRAMPLKGNITDSYKPEIVKDGYQTPYVNKINDTLFQDLNTVIENKCKLVFEQEFKATDYWFIFYETGCEVLGHNHWNLKKYYDKGKFDIYPLASAYYPLCSKNSSPIIFQSDNENIADIVIPVKRNTLLIFNANLMHYVPKSVENDLRLVYSCNLYAKKTATN